MKIYRNEPPKNKKIDWLYYLLWFVICFGIVAASTYPFVSDFVLAQKQKAQIEQFNKTDKTQSKADYLSAFYKKKTTTETIQDPFSGQKKTKKSNSVDVAKSELKTVGVLSIPKIKEVLPIYDNTSEIALDNGVGLLENTSPLVGGKGHHSVITGHSGLSLSRLFTDLPKLKKGDEFYIKVNNEIHAYKVDQIKVVLPNNIKYLQIDPDKDLVTLITCTPLFENTHRLLVRGHRVPYKADKQVIENDGGITSLGKAAITAILVLLGLFGLYKLINRKKGNKK